MPDNSLDINAFGTSVSAKGWALIILAVVAVAYGPVIMIGYIHYKSIAAVEESIKASTSASKAAAVSLYSAYTDGIAQTRYDHELIVYQSQLELCVQSLEKRPKEYEILRRNWVIEQIRVLCPFVQAAPSAPKLDKPAAMEVR